ncbi:MAG: 2-C-methyl-D-erythritol 2,4-cyclodiphosphate synthase [Planctomycetota bacterium]
MTSPDRPGSLRVGLGTDLHRLEAGLPLILGGVTIPSDFGARGHSDADVVLHAVSDALLGAAHGTDIGDLFPDDDPTLAGLDSRRIVAAALKVAAEHGFRLVNVDIVVALERPKLSPHREELRASLASILGIPANCVGIKAKTSEGLGPVGRGEAISCQAVALLEHR